MKIKKIGLAVLSLFAFGGVLLGITSCDDEVISNAPQVEVIEGTTIELASITLDTENVQKVFYVGDIFNYENLVVNRRFLRRDVETERILENNLVDQTKIFFIDTSEVDMNHVGEYLVYVSVRLGSVMRRESYRIEVKSSLFETTPNITYAAGLDVSFADNTKIKTYLLNSEELDANNLVDNMKFKLEKATNDGDGNTTIQAQDLTKNNVKIEQSVNRNEIGTYMIKVTYDNGNVNINGKNYENKVTSYVIVDVVNPIRRIQVLDTSTAVFNASIDGIDAEQAGWQVRVTPTVGSAYTDNFTYDKYTIENLDIFKWGRQQEVKVVLNADPTVTCTKIIQINESQTQDIRAYYNLEPDASEFVDGKPTKMLLAGTDFIFGPLPNKIDSDIYYDSGATYTSNRSDSYGSIQFPTRISIKGTAQPIKIVMDKPGQIVVFYASTNDEERDITFYNDKNGQIGDELQAGYTSSTKQVISRITFTAEEAGTYYILNTSGGIYVHGLIIAKSK